MGRHVHMEKLAPIDVHHHENVEDAKTSRDNIYEIASNDRFCVISNKGHPPLARGRAAWFQVLGPVVPHGPRRDGDSEFEEQLIGNAGLAPSGVLMHHLRDERPQVLWQAWPTTTRLPTPEELEDPPVPTDQSLRPNDHQSILPIKPPRPEHKVESRRIGQATRLALAFPIEGELFPEEQILCNEGRPGAKTDSGKPEGISQDAEGNGQQTAHEEG
jgi:hypothetical protein